MRCTLSRFLVVLAASALLAVPGVLQAQQTTEKSATTATLMVSLVKGAVLEIEGKKVAESQETLRRFVSPPLTPGTPYLYTLKAQWTENGKPRSREVSVTIQAGQTVTVDLRQPMEEAAPVAAKKEPVPKKKEPVAAKKEPVVPVGSFKVQVVPAELELQPGQKKQVTVQLQRDRFTEAVRLSFSGLPAHVNAAQTVIPAGQDSLPVEVSVSPTAPEGATALVLVAAGGTQEQKTEIKLLVKSPPASVRIRALPPVTVQAGSAVKVKLSLETLHVQKPIEVSFAPLPKGVAMEPITLAPAPDAREQEVAATVRATADAVAGNTTVKAKAVSGSAVGEGEFQLTVKEAPPAITLSLPGSLELEVGRKQVVPVKILRSAYEGPVTVTVEGLPGDVRAEPVTIPAGRNEGDLELALGKEAAARSLDLRVVASTGSSQATAPVRVTVKTPPPAPKPTALALDMPRVLNLQIAGFDKLLPVSVTREGIEEPIALSFKDVPPGVTLKPVTIPTDKKQVYVEASVSADAEVGEQDVTVTARAEKTRADFLLKVKITKR